MLRAEMIIDATKAVTKADPKKEYTGITTDSRTIVKGNVFVALKGENFDGHAYCGQVLEKGAGAVICEKNMGTDPKKTFLVKDTLAAYQKIAQAYRKSMKKVKVIAVTGSNGKTSTKDLIAACLEEKYNVIKTQANFNNEIGLPKTLLTITDNTDFAVVEIGMRGLGQIRAMKPLAEPETVVITNVGDTHIELLGSIENIAKAKSEILENLNADNHAILNNDDAYVSKMSTGANITTYGIIKNSAIHGINLKISGTNTQFSYESALTKKTQDVVMPLLGEHNVMNALAAIAVGEIYGVPDKDIAHALHNIVMTGKRQEILHFGTVTVINDAYNASPASMEAACKTLGNVTKAQGKGRALAVMSDMLELGKTAQQAHAKVGGYVADAGVSCLITYGPEAKAISEEAGKRGVTVFHVADKIQAAQTLKKNLQPYDVILFKGSHSMAVDKVIDLVFKKEEGK